jgi:hypothetical protein
MKLGVQLKVPDVLDTFAVNVPPAVIAVPEAVKEAIASPSGSEAETVKVSSVLGQPEAVDGAVTTGARSVFETVIPVVAEPLRPLVDVAENATV